MKKILILALAVIMAGTMAACGMGDVGGATSESSSKTASSQVASKPSSDSYDDSLAGLEKYLAANTAISGNPTEMKADFIGAKSGAKYQTSFNGNNNVTIELYEFDTTSINPTAKEVLDSVKKSGAYSIMDQKVSAVLSDSGKYLMTYKDTGTSDQNKAHQKDVTALFQDFKK
jgi:hypothetical protein